MLRYMLTTELQKVNTAAVQTTAPYPFLRITTTNKLCRDRGSTVVKVLCYKSECRWFYPNWCHWNFSLTQSF